MPGTVIVWVLVLTTHTYSGDTAFVIDDIASAASCEQLKRSIQSNELITSAVCAPVRKVRR